MGTKNRIIETAIRLFVDQGFEHTPTSQISKVANVATGTLFHHFGTKEDLINEAYLFVSRKSMDELKEIEKTELREYLRKMWYSGMEWSLKNRYYVKFMYAFAQSGHISPLTLESAEEIMLPYFRIMAALETDEIKSLPQSILVNAYNRIFEIFFNHLCETDTSEETMIEQGFTMLWDALRK